MLSLAAAMLTPRFSLMPSPLIALRADTALRHYATLRLMPLCHRHYFMMLPPMPPRAARRLRAVMLIFLRYADAISLSPRC